MLTNFLINYFFLLAIFCEKYNVHQFWIFTMNSDLCFFIHYQMEKIKDSDSIDFIFPEDENKQQIYYNIMNI